MSRMKVVAGLLPPEGHEEESVTGFSPLVLWWPSLVLRGLQKHYPYLCCHLYLVFSLCLCFRHVSKFPFLEGHSQEWSWLRG